MRPILSFILFIAPACNSPFDEFEELQGSTQTDGGTSDAAIANTGWSFDVQPREIHFGVVRVGEQRTERVSVTNVSVPPASARFALSGPGLEALSAPNTPLDQPITLEPGNTLDIDLQFMPSRAGRHEGELYLELCNGGCLDQVPLAGDGLAAAPSSFVCQSRESITLLMGDSGTTTRELSCVNAGVTPVTVSSVTASFQPSVELTLEQLALPLVVPAGAPFDFDVLLRRGTVGGGGGTAPVTIEIDDGSGPRSVEIVLAIHL